MTITPSASPTTRSPLATGAPAHSIGSSIAMTRPRPLESSGAIPPWKTGKPSARIARTSRTQPSITAPAAPRAIAAVVSNSPHGPMRSPLAQAKTGISPGFSESTSAISSS